MGIVYNNSIITDGLVLCLDAANSRSYSGSGTAWLDISKTGNVATLQNGPTFSNSKFGKITVDGSNDFINLGLESLVLNQATFEIIVDGLSNRQGGIATKGSINNTEIGLSIGYNPFLIVARPYYYNDQLTYPVANLASPINHIVYTLISNGKSALYVNGNEVATNTLTSNIQFSGQYGGAISNANYPLELGLHRYDLNSGVYSNIGVYFFKLYNRSLSAKEVLQNFNATRGRFGL